MIMVDKKKLCENCFAEIDRQPCPECGFDSNVNINDSMMLRQGSILAGRYAIGRVIGKGGFGVTYLAYDLKLECRVAVKEYYPYGLAARVPGSTQVSVSDAEETFQLGADKFYDEARLVAQFNGNPNIVSVHDFFYENNTVYFTMGYLDGQTLKDYLKEKGALTPGEAVFVAEAVSNALTAVHSRNVLHRDISPDNIMVCRDGTVKLLDFGAARQVLTEGSQNLSVILKQGYAPPEQYQKKGKQGPWTDIYSLGATLYYALTLDSLDDPMSRLEDDREYEANHHGIEEGLWRIIRKATELRGVDRYQDVSELRRELGSLSIEPIPLGEVLETGNVEAATPTGWTEEEEPGVTVPLREEEPGVTMPLRKEEELGVTVPLREEEPGVTVPLRKEEELGVTMPLREEEPGVTMPLREEEPGVTVPLQEEASQEMTASSNNVSGETGGWFKRKTGLWIAVIYGVVQIALFLVLTSSRGMGMNWAYTSLERYEAFIIKSQSYAAAAGGVTYMLLCFCCAAKIGRGYHAEGSHRIKGIWVGIWSCILIAAGVTIIITYSRISSGSAIAKDMISNWIPFVIMSEMLLMGGAYLAWKRGVNSAQPRKMQFLFHYLSVLIYYNYLILHMSVLMPPRGMARGVVWDVILDNWEFIALTELVTLGSIMVLYFRRSRACAVLTCLGGMTFPAICYLEAGKIFVFEGIADKLNCLIDHMLYDSERAMLLIHIALSVTAVFLTFYSHRRNREKQ